MDNISKVTIAFDGQERIYENGKDEVKKHKNRWKRTFNKNLFW